MPNETKNNPTFIAYLVKGSGGEQEKAKWIRFGALWKARTGFSGRIEDAFTLFPPFNDPMIGLTLMPYETLEQRNTSRGQRR